MLQGSLKPLSLLTKQSFFTSFNIQFLNFWFKNFFQFLQFIILGSNFCNFFTKKLKPLNENPIAMSLTHTIIDKIFQTNCSFHVKQRSTGKVLFLLSRSVFASIDNFFSGRGVRRRLRRQLRQLYTKFITNNHASFYLW